MEATVWTTCSCPVALLGQIEHPLEVARAQAPEREFEQDPGLPEAGRRLEQDRGPAGAGGRGQLGSHRFLPGAQDGEGRAEAQRAQPLARPPPQVEEFGDPLELRRAGGPRPPAAGAPSG